MSIRVFVGLGSNMDRPLLQLQRAVAALADLDMTRLLNVSGVYQTRPIGPADQADYLNAVAELESELEPLALLDKLQAIEKQQGRKRVGERWHQRSLDLDILLYDQQCIDDKRLVVPHPGMHSRAFVLVPLHELAADINIPGKGSIGELMSKALVGDIVKRLEVELWP